VLLQASGRRGVAEAAGSGAAERDGAARARRIVSYLLASSLPYRYAWCSPAATELATLAFYVTTALAFRPAAENPYLSFADDELDLDELRERGEI
jgi:hypothetical protein